MDPLDPNYLGGLYIFEKCSADGDFALGAIGLTGVGGYNAELADFTDYLRDNQCATYGEAYIELYNKKLFYQSSGMAIAFNHVYLGDGTIGPKHPIDYIDFDGDGYYGHCGGEDCDDTNPGVNPGIKEICDNGIDDDCDGFMDEYDEECMADIVFDLDASYVFDKLSLDFTIGTPEPVTWENYLILTDTKIEVIPLWTTSLPSIDPPSSLPTISFSFPQLGWIGIVTYLSTEETMPAMDQDFVYTGSTH